MRVRGFRAKSEDLSFLHSLWIHCRVEKMYYAVRNLILHFFSPLGNVFSSFICNF